MIAVLDRQHAQLIAPHGRSMLHIPIRLARYPSCDTVPGSDDAHRFVRADCGLGDRHSHGSNL
jgi:hypothetical protein